MLNGKNEKDIYIERETETETEKSVKVEKVGREREENWVWTKTIFTQRKWFSFKKKNVMKEKTKTARKETSVDLKNWGNENDLVTEFHE